MYIEGEHAYANPYTDASMPIQLIYHDHFNHITECTWADNDMNKSVVTLHQLLLFQMLYGE